MQDLAKLILANPVLVALVTGLLTTGLTQAWKLVGKPGDDAKVEKALVALAGAIVTTLLAQWAASAAGSVNWPQLITATLSAWLTSMGWYSVGKKLAPSKEAN